MLKWYKKICICVFLKFVYWNVSQKWKTFLKTLKILYEMETCKLSFCYRWIMRRCIWKRRLVFQFSFRTRPEYFSWMDAFPDLTAFIAFLVSFFVNLCRMRGAEWQGRRGGINLSSKVTFFSKKYFSPLAPPVATVFWSKIHLHQMFRPVPTIWWCSLSVAFEKKDC